MSGTGRIFHPRVAAWLSNFTVPEQDTAALLVNSLKLVSATDLRRELGALVKGLIETLPSPVAAIPSREVPEEESAHGEGRDGDYALFEPSLPGSEAVIASIITGIRRSHSASELMVDHFDLPTLRDRKVRSILLVDDFSGSGKRLLDFDKALRRHPTIRSWASSRHIRFHVALYSATASAAALLCRRFGAGQVHIVRPCPTFATQAWSPEQLADVEAFCVAYTPRTRKNMALGFRQTRALIAFEQTAPNNLPYVLWRVDDEWKSLFEGKSVPGDLLQLFAMAPAPPREPMAGSKGARRLGAVINLLGHRVRKVDVIAETLDLSLAEVVSLLKLVQNLGLASPKLRLTDRGLVELSRWRADHAIHELPNNTAPYYPRQLRAGR